MATLKDQLQQLNERRHRLAVWEMVFAYMDETFISRDGRPAEKGIRAVDAMPDKVPEEVIEAILQEIGDGPITTLKGEIEAIENQEIAVGEAVFKS